VRGSPTAASWHRWIWLVPEAPAETLAKRTLPNASHMLDRVLWLPALTDQDPGGSCRVVISNAGPLPR
jgi:hypothetical protein